MLGSAEEPPTGFPCYGDEGKDIMATESVQLKVSGMICSFCTMSIEKALKRYPGVNSVLVNTEVSL